MIKNDFELENKSHRHVCYYCHDCQRHYCDNLENEQLRKWLMENTILYIVLNV